MTEAAPSRAPLLIPDVRPDACLLYANTRFWRGRETPTETLPDVAALIAWAVAAAGFDKEIARTLEAQIGGPDAREARTGLFTEAIAIREAVYGIFGALASGRAVADADLAALNGALAKAPARDEIARLGDAFAWQTDRRLLIPAGVSAPALLAPVLWSAADLMTQRARHRIRQCANATCLWLFIDESKNGTRRWCDMTSCGNRAKARRHYLKSKKV